MNYAKKSFRPWMYFISSQLVPVLTFQNMAVCRVYTVVIICMISSLCLLWHCHFGLAGFQQNRIPTDSGPVEKWRSRGGKFCRWWLGIIYFYHLFLIHCWSWFSPSFFFRFWSWWSVCHQFSSAVSEEWKGCCRGGRLGWWVCVWSFDVCVLFIAENF